ncbi:MAG: hypothetical protein JW860_10260 [Sedimentisphaerales bacterium]|nr:hypothetical protein [Sedimentisphaerales bacterium]
MEYYLFDTCRLGVLIAVLVETILFFMWAFARDKVKTYWLLAGPVILGISLYLDYAVETNREQLERITREIVQAAEEEKAEVIINSLSSHFLLNSGYNKDRVAEKIRYYCSRPFIYYNHVDSLQVNSVQDASGQVEFSVTTMFDSKSNYASVPYIKTTWQFDYVRDADGRYRVQNMTMLKFGNEPGFDIFSQRGDTYYKSL